ncbi:MAG: DUF1330 domain-containing protein [Chloroflexi bacterium]|nr:DUF1330 domain-containing protein [Ktedonobacteraceae bacterium]MBV8822180.1 DUF1330 domain-containing protein [Ktedonobacteraceae bacterium]MBV9020769.1 DUF1330 domain-containing protein [Ktedonobacteraceae bacterium]MBV9705883.1 DUF1330 domain-containing protein [Chloroflexota bacterium]
MASYILANTEVTDPHELQKYVDRIGATIKQYGGKYIVHGYSSHPETLEGDWKTKIITIIEFPSAEQAKVWYDSPEYSAIKGIRERSSISSILLLHGV